MGPSGAHIRVCAIVLAAALTLAAGAVAKPDDPKPPKPRPKLELRTETQQEAISKQALKVAVRSKRGDEVRAKGKLVVDSFPVDYGVRIGPESRRLRDRRAKLKFKLSPRQVEALAFAAHACEGANVEIEARAGRRSKTGRLQAELPPEDC